MANNTIQLKRSSVAGKTPNTSTLSTGELAINLTDKKLYSSDGSNIFEPAGNVSDINITGGIKANGSFGTNGYTLSTNGSGIYWSPAGAGSTTNTTPSNIKNIVNTSVNTIASVIDIANATGISTIEYLISARDNINSNYKSARILITTDGTTAFITEYGIVLSNNSAQVCSFDSDINAGNIRLIATGDSVDTDVSLQRVVLGSATEAGDIAASIILDSVTNTAINISAAANSVKLAYDTAIAAYSNSISYTDTKIGTANTAMAANAAAAYTNAVAYTDSRIIDSVTNTSITHAASANSIKNAYDTAIDANTRANSAQTAATSAYSNAVSYVDTANFTRTGITTFSANVILGTSGLSSNGSFGTNGQVLVSNGSSVYWSTVSDNLTFASLSDTADLTVDRIYMPATTMLIVSNNGASAYRFDQYGANNNPIVYVSSDTTIAFNLNVAGHPFLIQSSNGANYNEGLTHVTIDGVVTTGNSAQGKTSGTLYWKIPAGTLGDYRYQCSIHGGMVGDINISTHQTTAGLSANVDTLTANNTSFVGSVSAANVVSDAQLLANLGNYQTTAGLADNVAVLTANNANNLGGVAAANYVNTSGAYTLSGNISFSSNLTINSNGKLIFTNSAGIYANGELGTNGQILTSNGSTIHWSTIASGSALTVRSTNGSNGVVNTSVANVTGINFDESTGFHVTDQGSGNVFVSLGSGYKFITVSGQTTITAVGEDTLNVANGDNIYLTTSNTGIKTLTIGANLQSFIQNTDSRTLSGNLNFTGANTYFSGKVTLAGNAIINAGISIIDSTGSQGTAGQVLASNGSGNVYWLTVSGGGFTNGQSISVNNFVVTGAVTANGSNGTSGQILASNGSSVYWIDASESSANLVFDYGLVTESFSLAAAQNYGALV